MESQRRRWKFGIGIAIILVVALWEAISGFQQSKTYYVTVSELVSSKTTQQHVRVGGTVEPGSITRHGETLSFRLSQNAESIPVVYVGTDTLPDTFKDGSKAIVQGDYMPTELFELTRFRLNALLSIKRFPPAPSP